MERVALTPYTVCGTVVKTQGLKGEVVVESTGDRPFSFESGSSLWVVPPLLEGPRLLHVSGVRDQSIVSFQEIESIDDASLIVGKSLLALREDIDDEELLDFSLIGFPVECSRLGALGTVIDEFETPANGVIVVEGPYGEALIPLVEGIVTHLPESDDDLIGVCLPKGIIDAEADVIEPLEGEDA